MMSDELRKIAAVAGIEGRAKMSKAELAEALEYSGVGECRAGVFTKGETHMCVIPGWDHPKHQALNGINWNAL